MKIYFLNNQGGFRNSFSTQHYLLRYLEKWKNAADKGKVFGFLFSTFDCFNYEFLTAKLNAYGFILPALRLTNIIYKTE